MVSKTKTEKITSPPVNMMLITIFYQIILNLEESILLSGLKLGDEALDVYNMDAKFV